MSLPPFHGRPSCVPKDERTIRLDFQCYLESEHCLVIESIISLLGQLSKQVNKELLNSVRLKEGEQDGLDKEDHDVMVKEFCATAPAPEVA